MRFRMSRAAVSSWTTRRTSESAAASTESAPPSKRVFLARMSVSLLPAMKSAAAACVLRPAATVSVKLVSSAGVGTIAVGVAKAYADAIQISGQLPAGLSFDLVAQRADQVGAEFQD